MTAPAVLVRGSGDGFPVDVRPLSYPCGTTWAPSTCRSTATSPAARLRSPIFHQCGQLLVFPHVCQCMRCGNGAAR